jgi:hypothetical protein
MFGGLNAGKSALIVQLIQNYFVEEWYYNTGDP